MPAILIAETDPHAIDLLPRILSQDLPDMKVDVCTSAEELSRNGTLSTYDTIAISPILLQGYHLLKYKADRHLLVPVIVTASVKDRALASKYLENDAFDLIVKPIVPHEASETVRLALWQNKLLRLLASRERASSRFQEHMKLFPHAREMEMEFESKMAVYERTIHAITTSLQHLLNGEEEGTLFDVAGFVESMTRKRALHRLLMLGEKGTTH